MKEFFILCKIKKKPIFLVSILMFISIIMQVILPVTLGKLVDKIILQNSIDTYIIIAIVCLFILSMVFNYFLDLIILYTQKFYLTKLSAKIFHRIISTEPMYVTKVGLGFATSRLELAEKIVFQMFNSYISILRNFYLLFSTIIISFYIEWRLLFIYVPIIPVFFIMSYFFSKKAEKCAKIEMNNYSITKKFVSEMFSAVSVIKAFNAQFKVLTEYFMHYKKSDDSYIKMEKVSINSSILLQIFSTFLPLSTIFLWVYLKNQNLTSSGNLIVFFAMSSQLIGPVKEITSLFIKNKRMNTGLSKINDILNLPKEVGGILNTDFSEGFNIRNLYFSYNPDSVILKNINLQVNKGEKVAIIGASGCGKSTLLALIAKFLNATEGSVFCNKNGINFLDIKIKYLRDKILYVHQDTILFSDTIKNNILFTKNNVSQEEFNKAILFSCADEFIKNFSEEFNYKLDEKATNILGGQKQRLGLARAFCYKPDVLFLDESTS